MTQNAINTTQRFSQIVYTSSNVTTASSTAIPYDNTIPQQSTEGTEYLTLAITPVSTASTLVIECNFWGEIATNADVSAAIFQDSTANALTAISVRTGSSRTRDMSFRHIMTSGTTSATTFKLKIGASAGGAFNPNCNQSAARVMGGVGLIYLSIKEYV